MSDQSLFLLFMISTGLNLGLAIYGILHRRIPGAMAFSLAMLMFALLPLMQALNISSSSFDIKVWALKSRVETAAIGATAWLIMIMQLTGYGHLVNRKLLLALSAVPLLTFVLNWTEHPGFRSNYAFDASGNLQWSTGLFFWFGLAYLILLLLAPLYLLWRSFRRSSPLSRQQTLALSLSVILPIAVNALSQLHLLSTPAINFPFAAGPLMGLIVAWAVFHYHLFDVVPFARSLLIESMSDGVLVLDANNRVVDVNPAMQELIGPVTIGQDANLLFSAWPELVMRFRDIPQVQTEIHLEGDPPRYFDIRISPLFEHGGRSTGRLLVVRDLTNLKQTEQRLQLQSEALNAAANAIAITDPSGDIQWVNPAFTHLTGYTLEESIGQNMRMLRSNRHSREFYGNLWDTIHAGLVWDDEIINVRKDGLEYVEQQTITPVKDEHGEITHFISIKQDVTARRQMQAALRQAEQKYRMLVEQIPAIVYMDVPDEDAASLYDSPQVEVVLGYPLSEWQEDPYFWKRCVYPDDFEIALSVITDTLANGHAIQEYRMIHKDGSLIWIRDRARLVRDDDGKPRYVQGFLEDVSERRRNEELLQRQNSYLETLHQITLDLLNQRATDDLLQSIVDRAAEFLGVPYGEVMLLEGDELVVKACTGNTLFLRGDHAKRGEAHLSWQAFDTGLPAIINEYFRWPLRRRTYEDLQLSAVVSLPILVGGSSIGVIDLSTSEPGRAFDSSEIEAATLFAQLAGLTLNNARLYAEAQHEIAHRSQTEESLRTQNDYLSALHEVTLGLINRLDPDSVLEAILSHVTSLMHTRHALVDIVDPVENVLVQKVALGDYTSHTGYKTMRGEGLTGQVWESGEVIVIPDYSRWDSRIPEFSWLRSVAGLPMKVKGRVIGVIGVSFDEPNRVFRAEEIELLQRFADLASVALDHAQLVSSAIRQSQELRLLHEVRTAITREVDVTRITRKTVEAIADTFGYTFVSLYLLEGDALLLQHQVGYENVIPKIAITEGVAGRVVRTGEAVLLEDVREDPSFLMAVEGIVSEVAVPLMDEGKPVGLLNIESRHGIKMTKADLLLMTALSDQISIAISRARVYSTLRRQNERLSTLYEITLELLNRRELHELPQTITDQIVRLLDAEVGSIALREGEQLVDRASTPPGFAYQLTRTRPNDTTTPAWTVFTTREPFVTKDFSALPNLRPEITELQLRALLLLPLLYGDSSQGVVGAARFRPEHHFDEDDIRFGNLFSKLAAIALDNAQLHETLRQESIRDPLTGLFNRRYMEETLNRELRRAQRYAESFVVVMLDLDHFKDVNDSFGHEAGDDALRKLGLLLNKSFRGSDTACRFGGEEFTLVLPGATLTDAVNRMEELRQNIKQLSIWKDGKTVTHLSASFGVSVYPLHAESAEQLLKLADQALYRAKQLGRDRVVTAEKE